MNASLLSSISESVVALDKIATINNTNQALSEGIVPMEIINALAKGMEKIGDQFRSGDIFLPEVMVACDVYKAGFDLVFPLFQAQQQAEAQACIVLGSIFGDVHTVGKDVASAVFAAAGFKVVDLGVTVKDETWVKTVAEMKPDIVGLGTYMTSTFMHTKKVVELLKEAGLRDQVKVICGGPSVSMESAISLGADGGSNNAWEAVEIMRGWLKNSKNN